MNAKSLIKAGGCIGLLMVLSAPASAWICSGVGNEFEDATCDATEISTALGVTFDGILLAKDTAPLDAGDGGGGGTLAGALQITDYAGSEDDTPLTVQFTWITLTGITPLVIVEKADDWYSVYDWNTQVTPLGGNEYLITRFFPGVFCSNSEINCNARTSHVSAYDPVPVPAAVWLFGSALAGLSLVGRWRKTL